MSFLISEDSNAKVEGQEILGVTGKFGLEVQNEARQRLTEFCQENAPVIANTIGTTDAEAETPILWPPDVKN